MERVDDQETRIDNQLANLLHGGHPIAGDHEQRVVALHELIILYNATQAAGWTRHTGDWDWEVTITWNGQRKSGYSFSLTEVRLDDLEHFTAAVNFNQIKTITLEGDTSTEESESDEEFTLTIPVDEITNVHWEWM